MAVRISGVWSASTRFFLDITLCCFDGLQGLNTVRKFITDDATLCDYIFDNFPLFY